MDIKIEYNENELKKLIYNDLCRRFNEEIIDESKIKIMVKTTHNYKAEWEVGEFKATIEQMNM